jgi:hypothetical protein
VCCLVPAPANNYNFVMFWQGIFWVVAEIDPGLEIRAGVVPVSVAAGVSPAESKSSQPTRLPLQGDPAAHPNLPKPGPPILAAVAYSGK